MAQGQHFHHLHLRKRFSNKHLEPYPHPKKWYRRLDELMFLIAFVAPFMVVPQLYHIVSLQTAEGVSAFSWFMFGVFNLVWLLYGILHKDLPVSVNAGLASLMNFAVVVLAFMY